MIIRELILDYTVLRLLKNKNQLFDLIEKSTDNSDGRMVSGIAEKIVSEKIISILPGLPMIIPPTRYWYDVGNEDFPLNIKITAGKGADNSSSKNGVFYAITGHPPTKTILINNHWDTYWNAMDFWTKNLSSDIAYKDYYFIVLDKIKRDIFWTSLRQLSKLGTPNGSNLPFQIPWADNKIRVQRTILEATKFLMSSFAEALEKSNDPLYEYKKHQWLW